jgi:subtilisin family serine protease
MRRQVVHQRAAAVLAAGAIALAVSGGAADGTDAGARPAGWQVSAAGMASAIVKLDVAPLVAYEGGVPGLSATSAHATGRPLDPDAPASLAYRAYLSRVEQVFGERLAAAVPGAVVTYRFTDVYGGAAVVLPFARIDSLKAIPGVLSVLPDRLEHLDTDRSPAFIGAPTAWTALGGQERAGEPMIVGMIDTGVWPEHPSLADPDPSGKRYAPPHATFLGTRACEFSGGTNPGSPFTCNNKLVGADRFMATYDRLIGLAPGEFSSVRDDDGHGTHTATTAAGNAGVQASVFGIPRGVISGIAPRAQVMAYKVCGAAGCLQSDSVAAIQEAIRDGVDVINYSISGGTAPYTDPVERAFLDAYDAGIFVAASAGNGGPAPDTVAHRGPWVTTVAASSTDRSFATTVTLRARTGEALTLPGVSLTTGLIVARPVVDAALPPVADPFCASSTADNAFAGKVVLCRRGGDVNRTVKSFDVARRGGVGMILYNTALEGVEADSHFVPAVHLEVADGSTLLAFVSSHTGVTASFPAAVASPARGDVIAPFSARGGSGQTLGISKPDVTAPGVQILAGNTPAPSGFEPSGQLFQGLDGTSMSSPHVAGAAALIFALHPDWSPGQVRSVLMTTAVRTVTNADGTPATPFDDGSGRISLAAAAKPGGTFDVSGFDLLNHQGQLQTLNYPSVYLPAMPGLVTVQRTLHSVQRKALTWRLTVSAPADVAVGVPATLTVPGNRDATFSIAVDAHSVPRGQVRHASLTLESGRKRLVLPITLVRA